MNKYYDNLNPEIKEYFKILSPTFPEWLFPYIDTPEMQRIGKISISCGTDYSSLFNIIYPFSNLDHSVGVALIIWNFTHDKKQTLAGLFHDIATPVFKHCIDFMNGDSEHQESTEERTIDIIKHSESIMSLLKNDGIKLEEVCDYKIYPIADNEMPKLSADRFEYTFSSGLSFFRIWELDKIKQIYNNITIENNEQCINELAFRDKDVCEEYISIISKIWPQWISNEDKIVVQFLADICKSMNVAGFLSIDDLYKLSEQEVIDLILNCPDKYLSQSFKKFQKTTQVYSSPIEITNKYCTNVKTKIRYIVPLVKTSSGAIRISKISQQANKQITDFLNQRPATWTYFDFEFTPYNDPKIKKYLKVPK
mgnify:FL=1